MKSESLNKDKIEAFWRNFTEISRFLEDDLEQDEVLSRLDKLVSELHGEVSWEVGPGEETDFSFVISPNGEAELLGFTRSVIALAPILPKWEFYYYRRKKKWNYVIELEEDNKFKSYEVSNWGFIMFKGESGIEISIIPDESIELTEDQKWQTGMIILESILGEKVVIEHVDYFEVNDKIDESLRRRIRPIHDLASAIKS